MCVFELSGILNLIPPKFGRPLYFFFAHQAFWHSDKEILLDETSQ